EIARQLVDREVAAAQPAGQRAEHAEHAWARTQDEAPARRPGEHARELLDDRAAEVDVEAIDVAVAVIIEAVLTRTDAGRAGTAVREQLVRRLPARRIDEVAHLGEPLVDA